MVKFHNFQKWALSALVTLGWVASVSASTYCNNPSSCPGFKTYTQNYWGGQSCGGSTAATSFLTANFATAFPTGAEIGCTNKFKFTTASAVIAYLPATGSAAALPSGVKTNPTTSSYNNSFAGNLLALALNLRFDQVFPSFGSSNANLKDLVITEGSFEGWTVQQFFDEANKKIGGCSASNYSSSTYSCAAQKINENYLGGSVQDNYLACPTLNASGVVTNVKCKSTCTGSITLTVSGGIPPYTYKWNNGSTSKDRTGLCAGNYSVTVKDAAGQSKSLSFCVSQPSSTLSLCITGKVDVKCYGGATGSINLTVSGGNSPYTYLWSNGAVSQDISGLTAGTYTVTVTDKNGCSKDISATINQPGPFTCSIAKTNATCSTLGSMNMTVTGGVSPFTYAWSNGATTEDISGLTAGTYSVVVTDKNGCTTTCSETISGSVSTISASAVGTDAKCYGSMDGSVDLTVTGANGAITYSWSNGATSEDLMGVGAGTYNVTVTDGNGCTATASATVGQPDAALSASTAGGVIDVTCFGSANGSVDLTVSGGTAPYTYAWDNGATSEDLTGVGAGTYGVVVTDKNGCTATASATVTEPTELTLDGTKKQSTTCAPCNGTATVTPTGGTGSYSYAWSTGATGSNELTGLCPMADLSVTVTDGNGCSKTYNFGPITQKEGCTAVEVVDFAQGLRQDFTAVDGNRSIGSAMFGAPENNDVLGTFYSLGFGGWAILRVDGSIIDKPGNDLKVVETTWHTWNCNRYTEQARVEVSQDNITWYDKGIICQDAEIDIAPLPCISYVRITDVSDRANFVNELPLADGFDVDGIICLNPPAGNGRKVVGEAASTPVAEIKQTIARTVTMYPNPADNQLFVNIVGAERGEALSLVVVDHMGREVKTRNITAVGAGHREEVNMEDLKPGVYMIRVNGSEMSFTKKIVKK